MPKDRLLRAIAQEDIRARATADGHVLTLTDDRLTVGTGDVVRLDVPIEDIRRIQFDIERDRPATLVIVPDLPSSEPQVIMVQPEDYGGVASALVALGLTMAERTN